MIDLRRVRANFDRRAQTFLTALASVQVGPPRPRDRVAAYVAMELQTALGRVARSVYLAHAVHGRTASGTKTGLRLYPSYHAALLGAAKVIKPKAAQVPGRDEPAWHSPHHFGVVSSGHGFPITVVTGMDPWVDTIRAVKYLRHFYAHRNQSTWEEVRDEMFSQFAFVMTGHPSEALVSGAPGSPTPFLEGWVWDYVDTVANLCG